MNAKNKKNTGRGRRALRDALRRCLPLYICSLSHMPQLHMLFSLYMRSTQRCLSISECSRSPRFLSIR